MLSQKTNEKLEKVMKATEYLVSLKKKKILDSDIHDAAQKFGLSYATLKHNWDNFQQTGGRCFDRRVSTKTGGLNITPSVKREHTKKKKNVTASEAGAIIKTYMGNNNQCITALANQNQITVNQFYNWIHELNVSGTLLGVTVLDPKKYAKTEVKDVIWLHKHPDTTRKSIKNLTDGEKLAYTRVADILLQYLP